MNPRRPTPADLESAYKSSDLGESMSRVIATAIAGNLDNFYRWCIERGVSQETCRDYRSYLRKPLNPKIRHSVAAYRLFYRFMGLEPPRDLRIPRSKPDRKIPSDEDVVETLRSIGNPKIKTVYWVMLQSGLRLAHAVYLVSNIDKLNITDLGSHYRVDLNIEKAHKKAYVAYLIELPERIDIAENTVSNYAKKLKVKPKYIRKYVVTKMHSVGIESDIVRFIVGHSTRDPHELSYYDRLSKADREYIKYARLLEKIKASL